MEMLLAVALLALCCVGAVVWMMRAREAFLNVRAGSLSRRWMSNQAIEILSDPSATRTAHLAAEQLLEMAFNPSPLSDTLAATPDRTGAGDRIRPRLGAHAATVAAMANHAGILMVLADPRLGRHLRKIVEGYREMETMSASPGRLPNARDQVELAASDLAHGFDRLDHAHLSDTLMSRLMLAEA